MPNYQVEYETWNEYENHVGESFFSLQVLPCQDENQKLIKYDFQNSIGEPVYLSQNHYGFDQLTFRSMKAFNSLRIHLECNVRVKKFNPFNFTKIAPEEEYKILSDPQFIIENHIFLQPTTYTSISKTPTKDSWKKSESEGVFDFLQRLNGEINKTFEYAPNTTGIYHSAQDAIKIKKGVCQDFAHVFITFARLNNIPCRYVSGYLSQGNGFIGASQMHAWVEAFLPGHGWVGFDPTNNILQDYHYIKVCHGVDYSECGPIRGVLLTTGTHTTKYEVKVTQQ